MRCLIEPLELVSWEPRQFLPQRLNFLGTELFVRAVVPTSRHRDRQNIIFSFYSPYRFADNINLINSSVTAGSRPSVCPFFSRITSATTRPSRQFGYTNTSAVPPR